MTYLKLGCSEEEIEYCIVKKNEKLQQQVISVRCYKISGMATNEKEILACCDELERSLECKH